MKHLAGVAIAILALVTHLRADSGPWQVRVEMQVISVPTVAALQIVPALRDPWHAEAAVNDLQAKIARSEAALLGWPVVWTGNRLRAVSETIEELRYPSEFEPPRVPQIFGTSPTTPPLSPLTSLIPTSFETRNLGITLEVLPIVREDGSWIDLSLNLEHVAFLAFKRFNLGKKDGGGIGYIDQPEFFTTTTRTQLLVRSGEWKLLGTFVVPNPEPHIELFILRATTRSLTP